MVEGDVVDWDVEDIPDADQLFLRVHVKMLTDGSLHPGIFREHSGGMSTDWEKYSTPELSRDRVAVEERPNNGIVALRTGRVRAISGLTVMHSPNIPLNNRAHTDVTGISGPNKTRVRKKLFDEFNSWALPPAVL